MSLLDRIALIVVIIGAVNWGCIGLFNLDLVFVFLVLLLKMVMRYNGR